VTKDASIDTGRYQRRAVTSSRFEVPIRLPRSGGNKTPNFGSHRRSIPFCDLSSRSREDDKFQEQSSENIPSFLAAGLDCPSGSEELRDRASTTACPCHLPHTTKILP